MMRQQGIAAAVWIMTAAFALGQKLPEADKLKPEADKPSAELAAPALDACAEPCCPTDCCCEPWQERFWVNTEYLLFWLRPQSIPPLITTGPAAAGAPVLGLPTTTVVSPNTFDYGATSGLRLNAGAWFRRNPALGFLASGFLLEQANDGVTAFDTTGAVPIGQPFLTAAGPGSIPASAPGAFGGGVIVSSTNRLWGSEANLLGQLVDSSRWNVSVLGGFRYLDMTEHLDIDSPAVGLAGVGAGVFSNFHDEFHARNQFYGGQLGTRVEYRRDRVFVNGLFKLGMGSTHQTIDTLGSFVVVPPGGPAAVLPGGAYVVPGFNQGNFTRDRFAVIPELQLNAGYQFNRYLSAYAGYNFLYWSNVERPGDQIDLNFSATQPFMPQNSTDFWAHGLNFGLGVRF